MRYLPIILVALLGCLDPYTVDFAFSPGDVLVIDGRLDATTRSVSVKLTRPQAVNDDGSPPVISGANVVLEGSLGALMKLTEEKTGVYTLTDVPVDYKEKYILNVTTPDGRSFVSKSVPVLRTPQIGDVTFDFTSDRKGIEVLLSTKDESGTAKYFNWEYLETYEYTSYFFSNFHFRNKVAIRRAPDEYVYRCWRTVPSFSIGVATTRDLSASLVNKYPVLSIPGGSVKLAIRYSVLIRQRVVSEEEHTYLSQMKKMTEQLDDFFGPQPSTVHGNFRETNNPAGVVLGFFSASEITQKRIFIDYSDLPKELQIEQNIRTCHKTETCDENPNKRTGVGEPGCLNLAFLNDNTIIIDRRTNVDSVFYTYTKKECGDCRAHGGVTVKPDFW